MVAIKSLLTVLLSASLALAGPHPPFARKRGIFDLTRNDLKEGKCGEIILVWARGTFELGNMGEVIGPELVDALGLCPKTKGRFIVQGVDYPASVFGYFRGGDDTDAQTMANLVARAQSQCPGAKIVMGGYSQGAQVLHKAVAKLTAKQAACVEAVIMFGDPYEGDALANNLSSDSMTICHPVDLICAGLPIPIIPHLTYAVDALKAANFIGEKCK